MQLRIYSLKTMQASMMEIYNEEVKDLLGRGPPSGKKHNISHDDKGCTSVTFVESVDCKRPEKVKDLLAKATRMRSVGKLFLPSSEQDISSEYILLVFRLRVRYSR